jgi:tRNA pseudouridine13 synthase
MTSPLPLARIKACPEDFLVEELPAYDPSGAGEHVFVRFTKRDLTTPDAAAAIARALGCDPREAGWAGMKDKRAVATQTISLHGPRGTRPEEIAARAAGLTLDGITVLAATLHGNKLKPGHLAGNRFTIVVRDLPPDRVEDVAASFERIARDGVPNAFGEQRFGRSGDNAQRALAWLAEKEPPPRDPRVRRLQWSAVQSAIFNAVLAARIADSTWTTALAGDVLKLRSSGGLFVCTDVQTDRERAATGEVSPTGPMVGTGTRAAEGAPGELERRITTETLGEGFDLARTKRLGEGTRRVLRLWVEDLHWERVDDAPGHGGACMRVYFVLPKGSYATTVLAAAVALDPPRRAEETSNEET